MSLKLKQEGTRIRLKLGFTIGRQHHVLEQLSIEESWVRLTRSRSIPWLAGIAGNGDLLPDFTTHLEVFGNLIESALTWFARAMRLQDDLPAEARGAYQESIRLRPTLIEAHVNLGLLHHNEGHLKQAETCYRRALRYQPALAIAHFNLGVVLEDQDDIQGALTAYQETLRWAPAFRDAHCHLAQLYEHLGRPRDAVHHYAAAKRLLNSPTSRR